MSFSVAVAEYPPEPPTTVTEVLWPHASVADVGWTERAAGVGADAEPVAVVTVTVVCAPTESVTTIVALVRQMPGLAADISKTPGCEFASTALTATFGSLLAAA